MNDPFQRAHIADLERLAEESAGDPVLGPQSAARLERARRRANTTSQSAPPRPIAQAAFFLRGESVFGSVGIDSRLAGQALIDSAAMFAQQAIVEEREVAQAQGKTRRKRGAVEPTLMFTGTPRGSFGFEFAPATTDQTLATIHASAINHVVRMIVEVSSDNEANEPQVPAGVLPYLKRFFKTLAQHDVSLRVVTRSGYRENLAVERVRTTAQRLEREVLQEIIEVRGVFRGITLDSGHFDMKADDETIISGTVSTELEDSELLRIHALTGQPCDAVIERTIIRHVGRPEVVTFLLRTAKPIVASPPAA